jgi:hypothetical protein
MTKEQAMQKLKLGIRIHHESNKELFFEYRDYHVVDSKGVRYTLDSIRKSMTMSYGWAIGPYTNQEVTNPKLRQLLFCFDENKNYNGTLKSEKTYDNKRGDIVEFISDTTVAKYITNIGFCASCCFEYGCKECERNQNNFDCGIGLNFSKLPEKPSIPGDTYKERCDNQLKEWAKGNAIHNNVDNECCPDFSCCCPELLSTKEDRYKFVSYGRKKREPMLWEMLSKLTKAKKLGLNENGVFIADGKTEIKEAENDLKLHEQSIKQSGIN